MTYELKGERGGKETCSKVFCVSYMSREGRLAEREEVQALTTSSTPTKTITRLSLSSLVL